MFKLALSCAVYLLVSYNASSQILPDLVLIPSGSFQMGSETGRSNELPVHSVEINQFYIGKYEVTFDQYDAFCNITDRQKPDDEGWGRGERPVMNVSWDDAIAYCQWLTQNFPGTYYLPSEAEWEYACRATSTDEYFWGSVFDDSYCWYYYNTNNKTEPIGNKLSNRWGLFDISGNVFELCADYYSTSYINFDNCVLNPSGNPVYEITSSSRVRRGGSWRSTYSYQLNNSVRENTPQNYQLDDTGFRVAKVYENNNSDSNCELPTTSYLPHFHTNTSYWTTTLTLTNYTTTEQNVTLTAYDNDGNTIDTDSVNFNMGAGFSQDIRNYLSGINVEKGWVKIEADTNSIKGIMTFTYNSNGATSSLPTVYEAGDTLAMPFMPWDGNYTCGLAVVNLESQDAVLTMTLRDMNGNILESVTKNLDSLSKTSGMLSDYFDDSHFENTMMLEISSDSGDLTGYALAFGDNLKEIIAVPASVVHTETIDDGGGFFKRQQ